MDFPPRPLILNLFLSGYYYRPSEKIIIYDISIYIFLPQFNFFYWRELPIDFFYWRELPIFRNLLHIMASFFKRPEKNILF